MSLIKPLGYDQKKCGKLIEERSLAGIILTSNDNVFYTTGIPVTRGQQNPILFALSNKFPPYSVIDSEGAVTPVVWAGALGKHTLSSKPARTSFFPGGTTEELLSCVEELFSKGSRMGVESTIPHSLAKALESRLEAELVEIDSVMDELRIIKSSDEIAKLRKSLEIAEEVERRLFREMRKDWTVFRLVSRSKQLIYELGGTGVDHATIAIGRSNPEILEDFPAAPGDIVVLDVGAILDGYASDTRRLGYIGKVPNDLEVLNGTMAEMVMETGRSLRPGKSFSQVCAEVEERYKKNRMDPLFLHAGHTIGIQTEEVWITRDSERKIEENMIFNIELYSQWDQGRYVGTEDTFQVNADGGVPLSSVPHEIVEI